MNIIPANQLDLGQAAAYRTALLEALGVASSSGTNQDLVPRDLAASDFNNVSGNPKAISAFNFKIVGPMTAATWTKLYAGTVALNTSIGIMGYGQLVSAPIVDAIRFSLGGSVQGYIYALDPIYCDTQVRIGYFDTPVLFQPQQLIELDLWSDEGLANSTDSEDFALLGVTLEPVGINVGTFPIPAAVAAALNATAQAA